MARHEGKKVVTLFGCGSENWKEMAQLVGERSSRFGVVQSQHFRATEAKMISDFASTLDTAPKLIQLSSTTLEQVISQIVLEEDEILLVTGSLFLVAEARLALLSLHLFDFPESDTVHVHDFFLTHKHYK